MTNLADDVKAAFLANTKHLGLKIVEQQKSESFGDALVILESGDLRVRIVRDRSQMFLDLGSGAEPNIWFDSATVMRALGLASQQMLGAATHRSSWRVWPPP